MENVLQIIFSQEGQMDEAKVQKMLKLVETKKPAAKAAPKKDFRSFMKSQKVVSKQNDEF